MIIKAGEVLIITMKLPAASGGDMGLHGGPQLEGIEDLGQLAFFGVIDDIRLIQVVNALLRE